MADIQKYLYVENPIKVIYHFLKMSVWVFAETLIAVNGTDALHPINRNIVELKKNHQKFGHLYNGIKNFSIVIISFVRLNPGMNSISNGMEKTEKIQINNKF